MSRRAKLDSIAFAFCHGMSEAAHPAPCRLAPCGGSRCAAAPTPFFILVPVAVNWIAVTLFTLQLGRDAGRWLLVVVFHALLALMATAWFHCCLTDPGTPPELWQRDMALKANDGYEIGVCRRSGLYKPPRSHFDSMTRRLTLNMDHFCPWVVNTVGFYNRKFFLLFLFYANLTLLYCLVALLAQLVPMWEWLGTDGGRALIPPPYNRIIFVGAMGVDALLILMLGPFFGYHLKMASRNETTIEGDRYPQYDVGTAANLAQVRARAAHAPVSRRPPLRPLLCRSRARAHARPPDRRCSAADAGSGPARATATAPMATASIGPCPRCRTWTVRRSRSGRRRSRGSARRLARCPVAREGGRLAERAERNRLPTGSPRASLPASSTLLRARARRGAEAEAGATGPVVSSWT